MFPPLLPPLIVINIVPPLLQILYAQLMPIRTSVQYKQYANCCCLADLYIYIILLTNFKVSASATATATQKAGPHVTLAVGQIGQGQWYKTRQQTKAVQHERAWSKRFHKRKSNSLNQHQHHPCEQCHCLPSFQPHLNQHQHHPCEQFHDLPRIQQHLNQHQHHSWAPLSACLASSRI